jgi:hypothetical protein
MSDPEHFRREEAIAALAEFCDCQGLAPVVRANGAVAEVDVLCRPKAEELRQYSFVIEVKSHQQVGDRELGPWIKQTSDYVGSTPDNGWPQVVAGFVWLAGLNLHPHPDEQMRMAGMIQLAQHFRVGRAYVDRGALVLAFGPSANVYRGGWTARATVLFGSKRVVGGTRKKLEPPSVN